MRLIRHARMCGSVSSVYHGIPKYDNAAVCFQTPVLALTHKDRLRPRALRLPFVYNVIVVVGVCLASDYYERRSFTAASTLILVVVSPQSDARRKTCGKTATNNIRVNAAVNDCLSEAALEPSSVVVTPQKPKCVPAGSS